MSDKAELRDCPFCGAKAKGPINISEGTARRPRWMIECPVFCVTRYAGSKKEVLDYWNTRAEQVKV